MGIGSLGEDSKGHIRLSDGLKGLWFTVINQRGDPDISAIAIRQVPEQSLRVASGTGKYEDIEPPYEATARDDWSGGRGSEQGDLNTGRFFDSGKLNTWMGNQIVLAQQEKYTAGQRSLNQSMPGSMGWKNLQNDDGNLLLSRSFTATAYDASKLWAFIRRVGNPGTLTYELRNDNSGSPGSTVHRSGTVTADTITDTLSVLYAFDVSDFTMTNGVTYWLVIYGASTDTANHHWQVGANIGGADGKYAQIDGTWLDSDDALYYRVTDPDSNYRAHFFTMDRLVYYVTQPDDNGAAKIYRNGFVGIADSNSGSLSKLKDSTQTTWGSNLISGGIAIIISGAGYEEKVNYRTITASANGECTVSPDWTVTHDASNTRYAIVGLDTWVEVTGHGLTVPASDVLVATDTIFMVAQGDHVDIREIEFENNGGTFNQQQGDLGGGGIEATFLDLWDHPADGPALIRIRNENDDKEKNPVVQRQDISSWSFGDSVDFTDMGKLKRDYKITGSIVAGDPAQLYFLTEDGIFIFVGDDKFQRVGPSEMAKVVSEKNGVASVEFNNYIHFSYLGDVARYYSQDIDQVGPAREEGLPADRQGPIGDLMAYPGLMFGVIDGGADNYSSILVYNARGWHELYRAPMAGLPIRGMTFQVLPGAAPDRLWFNMGSDMLYIVFPSDVLNPTKDPNITFTHEGYLETGWFYSGMWDLPKLWHSVKLVSEDLSRDKQEVLLDYRTDAQSTWTEVKSKKFNKSTIQEIILSGTGQAQGRRIKFRFRVQTDDNSITPKILAYVIEGMKGSETKHSFTFSAILGDEVIDIQGDESTVSSEEAMATLMDWSSNKDKISPLLMRSQLKYLDDRYVVMINKSIVPFSLIADEGLEQYQVQLTIAEL